MTQREFTVYDTATGRIRRFGTCIPADFEAQAADGQTVIEGQFSDGAFYVVDGEVVDRPRLFDAPTKTLAVSEVWSVNVPYPGSVMVNGQTFPIVGGGFDLSADEPGMLFVGIDAFPLQDQTVRVTVGD